MRLFIFSVNLGTMNMLSLQLSSIKFHIFCCSRRKDALILATCKHNRIKYLATLDEDFIEAAKKERIELIMKQEDLEKI